MSAEIVPADTPEQFQRAVQRAAELLRQGELVALPTETVYGLAANALSAEAVARIFEVKGRPAHNPIIVHVASAEMARRCVAAWTELAGKLAGAFWPGPLTLVLSRSNLIPDMVTAGGTTVGVRWPHHRLMQAVIEECGFPLAAPSANLSSRVSPTSAAHVHRQLGDRIQLIVDGGQSQIGIESTVLDLSVHPPRVLRPGMIHELALVSVAGTTVLEAGPRGLPLKSPGLLRKHYAPRARLQVLSWHSEGDLRAQAAEVGTTASRLFVIAHTQVPSPAGFARVSVIPRDPEAFARAIYSELHQCDEDGAEWILIESLPEGPEWKAIADRLNRAAAV